MNFEKLSSNAKASVVRCMKKESAFFALISFASPSFPSRSCPSCPSSSALEAQPSSLTSILSFLSALASTLHLPLSSRRSRLPCFRESNLAPQSKTSRKQIDCYMQLPSNFSKMKDRRDLVVAVGHALRAHDRPRRSDVIKTEGF